MTRTRLIVVGPVPPPVHGVTISTTLVLENRQLHERFRVQHLDTSDHRSRRNVGVWDARNVIGALGALTRLLFSLRPPRGVVYLPLSQSTPGFLRDSLFVHLAATSRWRVGVHLRGSDFRNYYENAPKPLQYWIRTTLRRLTSVAVMGDSLRVVFEGLVDESRIAVVPNGTPEPQTSDLERDARRVLFLSSLRRRKGVVQAIEAAILVLEQFPAARFTFVGSWESEELERELRHRTLGFGDAIEFRNEVDRFEATRLMAASSVLLFPPIEPEGHPRVVLEALACGMPVVTTDRGAIREMVDDGRTGYVLADAEPSQLADRVLRLLRDEALRVAMARRARETYRRRFTQATADELLLSWLRHVATGSPQ